MSPPASYESAAPEPSVREEARSLVRLAAPIAVAQLALVAMGLVDTAVVGRVSVDELAAVAIGRSISFAALALSLGMASALEPIAAQALGAGSPGRAWSALWVTLRLATLMCIVAVLASLAVVPLLVPAGVDVLVAARTEAYLVAQAPGQFFFIAFLVGKTFLQAHGITRPALIASVLANGINAVVCALLVLGDEALAWVHIAPHGLSRSGAVGAGISTSVASLALAAMVFLPAMRLRPTGPEREHVPGRVVFWLGLPVGLQLLAEVGVFSFVALLTGRLGSRVVSAHQIAVGLASFTFMTAMGVSGATAVRVGYAIGERRSARRAGLIGIGVGMSVMVFGAVLFATIPRTLMRAFTPDVGVIDTGVSLLGIAALFQLFDGVQTVAAGALRGAGDVRFPFVANVVAHWFVGLPIALYLGFGLHWGAAGLWWGLTAGLIGVALSLAARFAWLSRNVIRPVGSTEEPLERVAT